MVATRRRKSVRTLGQESTGFGEIQGVTTDSKREVLGESRVRGVDSDREEVTHGSISDIDETLRASRDEAVNRFNDKNDDVGNDDDTARNRLASPNAREGLENTERLYDIFEETLARAHRYGLYLEQIVAKLASSGMRIPNLNEGARGKSNAAGRFDDFEREVLSPRRNGDNERPSYNNLNDQRQQKNHGSLSDLSQPALRSHRNESRNFGEDYNRQDGQFSRTTEYKKNIEIEPYDPKEDFELFLERFESMCLMNNAPEHWKLALLKIHLRGRVAAEVKNNPEVQDSYEDLVTFLKTYYKGEESVAAARQKLEKLKIGKLAELVVVGQEISRLIDVVYNGEPREERLRKKRYKLAELMPPGIIRSLIKHDRPSNEPFDKTILVAKEFCEDSNIKFVNDKRTVSNGPKPFNGNCNYCKKKGHKEQDCRFKKRKERPYPDQNTATSNNVLRTRGTEVRETNVVSLGVEGKTNLPIIDVELNLCPRIKMLFDTGSEITILSRDLISDLMIDKNQVMYIKTLSKMGTVMSFRTKEPVEFRIGNQTVKQYAYVCNIDFKLRDYEAILGWDVIKQFQVSIDGENEKVVFHDNKLKLKDKNVSETNLTILDKASETDIKVQELKEEFRDIIAKDEFDLGSGKLICQPITLKKDCEFPKPANIPIHEVDKPILKRYLDKLEESGVIVKKPSPYAMSLIVLKKSDGRRRIIGDMRAVNQIAQPIYYSPPLIPNTILKMRHCSWFSKLDCNNAYFQISVPEHSQIYLAVRTPYGVYCFRRMVQGYINSAAEYQRIGEELLSGLEEYCTNYIDDFIIHTRGSLEFHIEKVKEVLRRMREADLRISFEKCSFFGKSVKYLGFLINEKGSIPHESNLKMFLQRPFPESKKALKSLVASANYYRGYIKNFSEITYPLDNLLRKKYRKLVWNDEAKEAYNKLVVAMSNPELCHHPKLNEDFVLTTDSSDHSIGGVLSQFRGSMGEVPIAFYSKRLTPTKRRRCITYRELFSISRCFRHFRYYFGGSKIYIRTDHLPLIGIFKNTVDDRYLELTNDLAGYNIEIKYVKGDSNVIADDLSRYVYKPNDENYSGDESNSDGEINSKTCVNVEKFLEIAKLEDFDTDGNESNCCNSLEEEEESETENIEVNELRRFTRKKSTHKLPNIPGKDLDMIRGRVEQTLKKRGRPRKHAKVSEDDEIKEKVVDKLNMKRKEISEEGKDKENIVTMPKRGRGRPRKIQIETSDTKHPLLELVENKDELLNIDFKKAQEEDDSIQESVKTKKYDGKDVIVKEGIVYVKTKHLNEGEVLKRIIPESLYDRVLCLAHKLRGHFSMAKTKHLIDQVGYMKSASKVIKEYIERCDECARRNTPYIVHPEMEHVNKYTMPFQCLAADILGPIIPTSSEGNKFLLVFIDCFSRYTFIIPCKTYSFDEMFEKIMNNIIWTNGNPLVVRTDNASNFRSEKLREVMETIGIKQEYSTAYHSRGNTICERALRWIQNTMAKLCIKRRDRWDAFGSAIAYYYNTTVCQSHGYTPYYLHYLRHPNTGLEQLTMAQKDYKIDRNPEIVELADIAKTAYKVAKKNLDHNLEKMRGKKARENNIAVGDHVYVKFPDMTVGTKLELPWKGPFEVLEVDGQRIVIKHGRKPKIVHFSNCKIDLTKGK
uniref:RNA-directed DNA polymerase n=1 Tax=Parastrongyloides trichosuri TaxID=131310 RepID=A0A0N4Z1I8_PARTI